MTDHPETRELVACAGCNAPDTDGSIAWWGKLYRRHEIANGRPDPGILCGSCSGSRAGKRIGAEVTAEYARGQPRARPGTR